MVMAARRKAAGGQSDLEAGMAKYLAAEYCKEVVEDSPADPRRLRLLDRVRDRAAVQGRADAADRGGHRRDPEDDHRASACARLPRRRLGKVADQLIFVAIWRHLLDASITGIADLVSRDGRFCMPKLPRPLRLGGAALLGLATIALTGSLTSANAATAASPPAASSLSTLRNSLPATTDPQTGSYSAPSMTVEVALAPRNQAALNSELQAIYTKGSGQYHQLLPPGQFDASTRRRRRARFGRLVPGGRGPDGGRPARRS